MEHDDDVPTRTFGGVGDSVACALWEGFLRCVRVLPCEHESGSNVCSDMSLAIDYLPNLPTPPGRARDACPSVVRPRPFLAKKASSLPLTFSYFYTYLRRQ